MKQGLDDLPKGLRVIDTAPKGGSLSGRAALLECRDGTADKFWGALEDDGDYIIFWGRNGRRPQQSQRLSEPDACARIRDKLAQGYAPSLNPEKIQEAFFQAPEWFDNMHHLSGGFKALLDRVKISLSLDQAPTVVLAEVKRRSAFRL